MEQIDHAIGAVIGFIVDLFSFVVGLIGYAEHWVRAELGHFGLPQNIQTVILIVVAIAVLLTAVRLLGGVLRVALVVLVVLIAAHMLIPLGAHAAGYPELPKITR